MNIFRKYLPNGYYVKSAVNLIEIVDTHNFYVNNTSVITPVRDYMRITQQAYEVASPCRVGLVVSVSASRKVGREFASGQVIPKTN